MERGLNSVVLPRPQRGHHGFENSHLSKQLMWQLGFFRNNNDSDGNDKAFVFDDWSEASYDLAARVGGSATSTPTTAAKVVHLGGGYIHQFRFDEQNATLRYRARPETHLAQSWVDTTCVQRERLRQWASNAWSWRGNGLGPLLRPGGAHQHLGDRRARPAEQPVLGRPTPS